MLKALNMGVNYSVYKKEVDQFYDENLEFRNEHPEYKKWEGDYQLFQHQRIKIL